MASCIGAQMYTIREFCKTPADIAASCAKLRHIGYENVQVSGIAAIEVQELARILDGEGLACVSTHKGVDDMRHTAAFVDYHAALRCKYPAIGGWGWGGKTLAEWKAFIQDYSQIGKTLAAQGLKIGYHNHAHELCRVSDTPQAVPLELMLQEMDPSVWFEIDTYWIAFGGGEPSAWIDRVAGRIPCVHFKDLLITPDMKQHKMVEIGRGNLNWPRILETCRRAGVHYYLVERDAGDLDPFESLRISLENMKAMGLK